MSRMKSEVKFYLFIRGDGVPSKAREGELPEMSFMQARDVTISKVGKEGLMSEDTTHLNEGVKWLWREQGNDLAGLVKKRFEFIQEHRGYFLGLCQMAEEVSILIIAGGCRKKGAWAYLDRKQMAMCVEMNTSVEVVFEGK